MADRVPVAADGPEPRLGVGRMGWRTPTEDAVPAVSRAAGAPRGLPVGLRVPDLSAYRRVTGWAAAAREYPIIICKATEGRTFVDPSWRSFLDGCLTHRVFPVAYHFLRRESGVVEQARHFVAQLPVGPCGVMLDVETSGAGTDPTVAQADAWLDAVCELTGRRRSQVLVYLPRWWYLRHGGGSTALSDAMLVNSHYAASPDTAPFAGFPTTTVIQYSSTAPIAGVAEPGDMNIVLGRSVDWFAAALGLTSVPPAVSVPPEDEMTPEEFRAVVDAALAERDRRIYEEAFWVGPGEDPVRQGSVPRVWAATYRKVGRLEGEVGVVRRGLAAVSPVAAEAMAVVPSPPGLDRVFELIASEGDPSVLAGLVRAAAARFEVLLDGSRGDVPVQPPSAGPAA